MPVLLNVFGDLEELIADHLYPHRYIITPIIAAVALAALYAAYRLGAHRVILRHRVASAAIGLPLLAVSLVAGDYLLSPLWERSTLNEASPLEASGTSVEGITASDAMTSNDPMSSPAPVMSDMATATPSPALPAVTHRGEFVGADDFHFGRGDALIIRTAEGANVLRFENFSVRNGPDLYVYLTTDPSGESVDEALNLGRLKATDGAFNYEIPEGIDLEQIASVVVWCRQFSVLFAVAEFQPSM